MEIPFSMGYFMSKNRLIWKYLGYIYRKYQMIRRKKMLTQAYLVTTKNLSAVINSVVSARAPERFNNKFLENLNFKSSNDRLYIGVFKALGLIDESGVPTSRYFEFIDQTQTGKILAIGIQEAYEDLFNLRKDAQNLTVDEVKNKLKTLTQGQKTENVLGLMANTFKALCDEADWVEQAPKRLEAPQPQVEDKTVQSMPIQEIQTKKELDLHYNIQIHLPETTNMAVYDAIFQSLKKHLM